MLAYGTIKKSSKKGKIHELTPKSYVSTLTSYVSEPPRHTKIIEEWQLIDDVICRSVDIKYVLIVIEVGHGKIQFDCMAGTDVEFLFHTQIKPMVAGQSCLVKFT